MLLRPKRLLVVASIVMDVIMYVDALPPRGGDLLARSGRATPGGAFNVIAAARRLGLETAYGGLMGDGPFGRSVQEALREVGAERLHAPVPRSFGDTGFDVVLVETDGERTFVTAPGCESELPQRYLEALALREGDAIYASGYDLVYENRAFAPWLCALPATAMLLLDPGPLVLEIAPDRLEAVLARVDILSVNRREGGLLTGCDAPQDAAAALALRLRPEAFALVRAGAEGAWLAGAHLPPLRLPSRPAKVVDTTGAGDVHAAALLARLAQGSALAVAVREANFAASLAVERAGPSESPTVAELEAVLAARE